ncbi:MAG TPA: PARP-type zinc finger-containing protein [Kofleriaceae bacterium]
MANVIEEAKSGRASCRTCKKTIAKGELRFGVEAQTQFSDTPSLQWHHLLCAAQKLPVELAPALAEYAGEIPNRAELDAALADAGKKGAAKPAGFPYVDKAPTGRAKCMLCEQPIEKASYRVAIERELEVGANVTRGAGYLHPRCAVANLENTGGSVDELVEGIRAHSKLTEDELDGVIADLQEAGEEAGVGDK